MTTRTIAKPSIKRMSKKVMLAKTWESGDEDSQNRLFIRNAEQESNKEGHGDQII
jgi:hypothetical protein